MFVDILLICIAIASLGYIIYRLKDKLPKLANINVQSVPETKQNRIKRTILKEKLKRDVRKRWTSFRDSFLTERKRALSSLLSSWYQRLKDKEREYRQSRRSSFSKEVGTAQLVEENISRARQHVQAGEYALAEQVLIDSLTHDEHNVKAYIVLAQVYREQKEYDKARQTLEYVVHLTDSKDPVVYSSLASLARERGDMHTAQEDYLRSIALDPENYKFYLDLAEVYRQLEQYLKSQDAAQKALEHAQHNPKILDFLIENSILLQDKNRAQEYLAKLVEVNPQNGKIATLQERIDSLQPPTTST